MGEQSFLERQLNLLLDQLRLDLANASMTGASVNSMLLQALSSAADLGAQALVMRQMEREQA